MKREFLKSIEGLSDEVIDKIMTENGKDVNKLKEDLKTANDTIGRITGELKELKDKDASSEDWKAKYDELQKEQEAARLEKEKAEKEASDRADFEAAAVDKNGKPLEFVHEAVKESYFKKYVSAKADKANQSKTGAEIFHDLIKDDNCIKVSSQAVLAGGSGVHNNAEVTKEQFNKMGYSQRAKIFEQNPDMYKALTEKI